MSSAPPASLLSAQTTVIAPSKKQFVSGLASSRFYDGVGPDQELVASVLPSSATNAAKTKQLAELGISVGKDPDAQKEKAWWDSPEYLAHCELQKQKGTFDTFFKQAPASPALPRPTSSASMHSSPSPPSSYRADTSSNWRARPSGLATSTSTPLKQTVLSPAAAPFVPSSWAAADDDDEDAIDFDELAKFETGYGSESDRGEPVSDSDAPEDEIAHLSLDTKVPSPQEAPQSSVETPLASKIANIQAQEDTEEVVTPVAVRLAPIEAFSPKEEAASIENEPSQPESVPTDAEHVKPIPTSPAVPQSPPIDETPSITPQSPPRERKPVKVDEKARINRLARGLFAGTPLGHRKNNSLSSSTHTSPAATPASSGFRSGAPSPTPSQAASFATEPASEPVDQPDSSSISHPTVEPVAQQPPAPETSSEAVVRPTLAETPSRPISPALSSASMPSAASESSHPSPRIQPRVYKKKVGSATSMWASAGPPKRPASPAQNTGW